MSAQNPVDTLTPPSRSLTKDTEVSEHGDGPILFLFFLFLTLSQDLSSLKLFLSCSEQTSSAAYLFILLTFQQHLGSWTLLKPDWSISVKNISKYVFLRETDPSAAL